MTKTINDIMELDSQRTSDTFLDRVESDDQVATIKERLHELGYEKYWKELLSNELSRVHDLMEIDLAQILSRAWVKLHELRKYADKTRYDENEVIWVALADHSVKSEHHPHIDVISNEIKVGQLDFLVTLSLLLWGVKLKIQAGRIKAFRAGSCKGSGELKIGGISLTKQETKEIDLGKEVSLGEGLLIS